MAGSKWRLGIIFETQLDSLSDRLASDLCHYAEAKVDA
jgi:hypothetical protein